MIQNVRVIKFPKREGLHNYQASSKPPSLPKILSVSEASGQYPFAVEPSTSTLRFLAETSDGCVTRVTPREKPIEAERPAITVLRLSGYVCEYFILLACIHALIM